MIKEIRNLEDALGNGVKEPVSDEITERLGARRSIYSAVKITDKNLVLARPLVLGAARVKFPPYWLA